LCLLGKFFLGHVFNQYMWNNDYISFTFNFYMVTSYKHLKLYKNNSCKVKSPYVLVLNLRICYIKQVPKRCKHWENSSCLLFQYSWIRTITITKHLDVLQYNTRLLFIWLQLNCSMHVCHLFVQIRCNKNVSRKNNNNQIYILKWQ
jgi:hypothetical protein